MVRVLVQLRQGYGDGFGVAAVDDSGELLVGPAEVVATDNEGTAIRPPARRAAGVDLESGVRVPRGAIVRVIGPLDCPEAIRIQAEQYTRNWTDRAFVARATDEQLRDAMLRPTEQDVYAAMSALRAKCA